VRTHLSAAVEAAGLRSTDPRLLGFLRDAALVALATGAAVYAIVIVFGAGPMSLLALGAAVLLLAGVGAVLGWEGDGVDLETSREAC